MKKMKICVAMFLLLAFSYVPADAQKKPKTTEKKEEVKPPVPPPPAPPEKQEGIKDVEIESLPPAEQFNMPSGEVNFDTTAVVEDQLTNKIRHLLLLVGAAKTDVEMAEASLNESLKEMDTALSGPFKRKFMYEMTSGRASVWFERLYIRNYRALFTPEEIEGMIDFYNTPLGKSLLKKQPRLLQTVMLDASKIGRYLGMKIMNELME